MRLLFIVFAILVSSNAYSITCTSPACEGDDLVYRASGPDGRGGATCFEVRREKSACQEKIPDGGSFYFSCDPPRNASASFKLQTTWSPYPRWSNDVTPLTRPNLVVRGPTMGGDAIRFNGQLRCDYPNLNSGIWCADGYDDFPEWDSRRRLAAFVSIKLASDSKNIEVKVKSNGGQPKSMLYRREDCRLDQTSN